MQSLNIMWPQKKNNTPPASMGNLLCCFKDQSMYDEPKELSYERRDLDVEMYLQRGWSPRTSEDIVEL